MIRTIPNSATTLQIGSIVAFNQDRFHKEFHSFTRYGTYQLKITGFRNNRRELMGCVVWSANKHFTLGYRTSFFETRYFDLVPEVSAVAVKPKRARLEKFTVFDYDGEHKVMAANPSNAKFNVAKQTGYSLDSLRVYAGHLVELRG